MTEQTLRGQTALAPVNAAATATASTAQAGGLAGQDGYPKRWLMLPVILIAMFMAGFDIWAVNVAAPSLQRDLHVSDAALQLIVGGYAFMYASGMVTGGRLGDLFGYKRLFLIGVVAFALASLACGLAPSAGVLVAFRLIQGLTGALMVPQVVALITAAFPARERSRALGWYGATMGFGFVSGQILGGGLIQANIFGLGWRAIFLVNVPVAILAVIVATIVVPAARGLRKPRLDPLGAVGVSGALALALVPLTLGRDEGWPVWTWVSLALALPVLAVTLAWERRLTRAGADPLLNLALFRDRAFSAGLLLNFAALFFFGSFMFVLTLLLQSGLGLSPLHAGIVNLPLALTFIAMTLLGPKVAGRLGPRSITLGAGFAILGTVALALIAMHSGGQLTGWGTAPATALIGIGQGLMVPSLMGAVLTHVRPEQAGAAAGVLTTTQQFAIASGVAVIGAVFYEVIGGAPTRANFVSGLAVVAWIDAALLVIAAALTFLLPRRTGQQGPVQHHPVGELADEQRYRGKLAGRGGAHGARPPSQPRATKVGPTGSPDAFIHTMWITRAANVSVHGASSSRGRAAAAGRATPRPVPAAGGRRVHPGCPSGAGRPVAQLASSVQGCSDRPGGRRRQRPQDRHTGSGTKDAGDFSVSAAD